jgi:heptosyltransferase-2
LIISYLFDPDRIFENNMRRCGVENLLCGPAKIVKTAVHAARQLALPIEQLGIEVGDLTEKVFPSIDDRQFAKRFLQFLQQPILAIHPGSGSTEKNWPLENWIALFSRNGGVPLTEDKCGRPEKAFSLAVISGEADKTEADTLAREWKNSDVRFANNLPLPHLAAVLERSIFIGHDSGISHLAAAAGANCVLMFGPTDPNVWAPRNKNVQILRAQSGKLSDLGIGDVKATVAAALGRR